MLSNVFIEIRKNKDQFATSNDGAAFEEKLARLLKQMQYTKILNDSAAKIEKEKSIPDQISKMLDKNNKNSIKKWKELKNEILEKNSCEISKNPWPELDRYFIHQPFGSQNFPDFIFFTRNHILPVEIKYSKSKTSKKQNNLKTAKPMWNSNLPKGNAIYIFGVSGKGVTFFKGADILDSETRKSLNKFFEDLGDENEKNLKIKMEEYLEGLKNPFGFKPYVRRAFEQSLNFSTLTDKDNKKYMESYFSDKSHEREDSVISFLSEIENEDIVLKNHQMTTNEQKELQKHIKT